jgi:transposase
MTDAIVAQAQQLRMAVVIPSKKDRSIQRPYDKALYRLRHLLENGFLALKLCGGIGTCYAKSTESFMAAISIGSLVPWGRLM